MSTKEINVKSVFLAALAAAAILPLPAMAQSLNDTHELVWHPSGKTPTMFYRLRDRPACIAGARHHQSGKTPLTPRAKCVPVADARSPTTAAKDPATAR